MTRGPRTLKIIEANGRLQAVRRKKLSKQTGGFRPSAGKNYRSKRAASGRPPEKIIEANGRLQAVRRKKLSKQTGGFRPFAGATKR
jgi:hypothetical protein